MHRASRLDRRCHRSSPRTRARPQNSVGEFRRILATSAYGVAQYFRMLPISVYASDGPDACRPDEYVPASGPDAARYAMYAPRNPIPEFRRLGRLSTSSTHCRGVGVSISRTGWVGGGACGPVLRKCDAYWLYAPFAKNIVSKPLRPRSRANRSSP